MKNLQKKVIVMLVSLLFIFTAVTFSSAETIQNKVYNTTKKQTAEAIKEITLYRFGPDGSITPQKIQISIEEGQDVGEIIANECDKLFDNDIEMQGILNGNNSTSFVLKRVTSYGRGFHLKINARIQLDKKIKLFPLLPPYFKTAIILPIRYCKYTRDPGAYTRISGLNDRRNITQEYRGPHEILAIGFYGYTGWIGHISALGFIFRSGFAGFSLYVKASEF